MSGAVVGVNGASDKLLLVSGLIPFVLASGFVFISGSVPRRRVAFASGTTVVTAVVFWILTDALAQQLNVVGAVGSQYSMFAGGDQISHNVSLWWQSIARLANGNFFGAAFGFTSGVYLGAGLLSIAAVLLLPVIGWRQLKPALGPGDFRDELGQLAFTLYWCSSAVLLTLSFWVSAAPADIFASRYLVGLLYAAAAVLPATAAGRLRREAAVAAGTAVFALSAVISIAQPNLFVGGHISAAGVNSVVRFALSHDASVGYSGYWDAAPISWASRLRVKVYPVAPCGGPSGLCTFNLHASLHLELVHASAIGPELPCDRHDQRRGRTARRRPQQPWSADSQHGVRFRWRVCLPVRHRVEDPVMRQSTRFSARGL